MDPDPGGLKTYGSGFGSITLLVTFTYKILTKKQATLSGLISGSAIPWLSGSRHETLFGDLNPNFQGKFAKTKKCFKNN